MANERRVRANNITGTTTDNPLASGATTINSAGLASLPAIGATEHAVLILDPAAAGAGPEIVYVTSHTGAATSATIVRGREGTSGVQHSSNTTWIHGPTLSDFVGLHTSAARPSGNGLPYVGQRIYETDTDRELVYNTELAWVTLTPVSASVLTEETETNTAYDDMTTPGPAVTLATGTEALITLSATLKNSSTGALTHAAVAVSGATTLAAADDNSIAWQATADQYLTLSHTWKLTGLTAGSNVFTVKYKVGSGTGSYLRRRLTVVGIP